MDDINELVNKIKLNAKLYYEGNPLITNEEFDYLVESLRSIDPNNEVLNLVGWGYDCTQSTLAKFSHMTYLSRIKSKPRVEKESLLPANKFKTPKLDGGSVELQYINGTLVRALTRGNGSTGLDCTSKLRYIVPINLKCNYTGDVVGEFVISDEDFNELNQSDAQRNIPNGFLNRKSVTEQECKHFSFIPYKIDRSMSNKFTDRKSIIEFLNNVGFNAVDYCMESDTYINLLNKLRFIGNKHYLLDGIVSSDEDIQVDTDGTIHYINEIAFKTINDSAQVEIKNVDWNLTRTGKMIPTIEFDPVFLSGASIDRTLAHNYKYVVDNGISKGAIVEIIRSGEVIPYITQIIQPVTPEYPEVCPVCGKKLSINGVHLVCNNPECEGRNYSNIVRWIKVLASTDNMGLSLIDSIIDGLNIETIEDLYKDYSKVDFSLFDGVGSAKVDIIKEMFTKLKSPHYLYYYIVAMNISGLSWESAYKIEKGTSIVDTLLNYDYYTEEYEEELLHYKNGVSFNSKLALFKNWNRLKELSKLFIIDPYLDTQIVEVSPDDIRIKICITGSLSNMTKKEFYNKYQEYIIESSVDNCDYLICNDNRNSSKYKKALKLNKPIITEDKILSIMKGKFII